MEVEELGGGTPHLQQELKLQIQFEVMVAPQKRYIVHKHTPALH